MDHEVTEKIVYCTMWIVTMKE